MTVSFEHMLYVEAHRIRLSPLKYSAFRMEELHVTVLIEHCFSTCCHLLPLNLMLWSNDECKKQMATQKRTKQTPKYPICY